MIRKVQELELRGKRVFVRVDFNVPVNQGRITEAHRIDSALPTLKLVIEKADKVLIGSHLGRPGGKKDPKSTLAPVGDYLARTLGEPVTLAPDCVGPEVESLLARPQRRVILLENLRFHKEEEENDPAFSQALAALADVYVNDAFGTAHRAHASTVGMVRFFKIKGAGLLLQKELEYLGRALSKPEKPFVAVLGGAKVSDKIGVLKNLLSKVSGLLIGGGMAYTFLKARSIAIGKSIVEEERIPLANEILAQAKDLGVSIHLPTDHVAAKGIKETPIICENIPPDSMGLDIGPKTASRFREEILKSKMVLWNGPVGLFEEEPFSRGTRSVAQSLAQSEAVTIVAGGETVAAVRQAGVEEKITHLSTGGGATLEFLEGRKLPGIEALEAGE